MSASVFFASEYLQCIAVDPSFAIAKSVKRANGVTNFKPPSYNAEYNIEDKQKELEKKKESQTNEDNQNDNDNDNNKDVDHDKKKKISGFELSDEAKSSILLHWKHAPTALHYIQECDEAQSQGKIIKRQSTYISRDSDEYKDDDDDTFFEKVGNWFDNLGKKIENEAEKLKNDVFKQLKDIENDIYKYEGAPTYYEYYLCTNKHPHGKEKNRVAFVTKHTLHSHNIFYVPAVIGQYPWYVVLFFVLCC